MKITLWYDPVRPETEIQLDGCWVDGQDIYSFLYPVRRCLLQTWLTPSGSWSGLEQQIRELARGQTVKLEFHGRECDAHDICTALSGQNNLTVEILLWDPEQRWRERLNQAETELGRIIGQPTPQDTDPLSELPEETGAALYPTLAENLEQLLAGSGEENWLEILKTEEDLLHACRHMGTCCIVQESLLDSYERLVQLKQLTRSMRRCSDMICCVTKDEDQCTALAQYTAQVPGLEYRFGVTNQDCWQQSLWEKYGAAFQLRNRLLHLTQAEALLKTQMLQEDMLREQQNVLKQKERRRTIKATELREKERIRKKLNWIRRKAETMAQLGTLLHGGIAAREVVYE